MTHDTPGPRAHSRPTSTPPRVSRSGRRHAHPTLTLLTLTLTLLTLSCLVPRPAVAQISCVPLADTTLPNSEARVCHVAHNWGLIPTSSLNVGDRFRLMLITSNMRGRDSNGNIDTYNTFVQNRITNNGHAAIRAYGSEFRAVVSTNQGVTARDNTHTSRAGGDSGAASQDGLGVPIYWLGGGNEKLADNNFPGLWFNDTRGWALTGAARRGRNENGARLGADTRVWTGSNKDGTGASTGSHRLGDFAPQIGRPDRSGNEISNNFSSDGSRGFYALSPIFHISPGISLDTSTTPAPESSYQYPINVEIDDLVLPPATGGEGAGTLSYALTGTLPTGLAFDTATRTLSGTPNTATTASASLTYTITASASPITLALTFTVDVKAAGITWTGGNIVETADNDGTIGGDVVATLVGDTFATDVCTGANYFPGNPPTAYPSSGVTIDCTRTGDTVVTFTYSGTAPNHADADDLVGEPPYNAADPGIVFIIAPFTNSALADVANIAYYGVSFDFNDPDPINFPDIEAQTYPTHTAVAFTLPEARGGTGPFTYALRPATLPAGLTFDPATRAITGTPFETTVDTFIYTATDATGTGATDFTITVIDDGTRPASNTVAVAPTIIGDLTFSSTLSVDPAGITDANGILTDTTFAYQWQQGAPDGTETGWAAITDAIASEYTILAAQGGRRLRVQISFTDAAGHLEIIASAATDALPAVDANTEASGALAPSGGTQAGSSLIIEVDTISDANGITGSVYSYQWQQGGTDGMDTEANYADLPGATSSRLFLTEFQVGRRVRVVVSFLDDAGNPESLTSSATAAVTAAASNNVASGSNPTITGPFRVGRLAGVTFTSTNILDTDGGQNNGQYRWEQGPKTGEETPLEVIPGETFSNLLLTADQEGRRLRVTYFYFDGKGYLEEFTSAFTEPIAAAVPNGFVFTPTAVALDEGAATTYTVALATPLYNPADLGPALNVEVAILSDNPLAVTVDPLFLTFTQFNFSTAQTVTVTARQDANGIDETVTLTHTAPGEYNASAPLQVTVTDDEESELTLTTAALTLDEATTATYSVSLAAVPTDTAIVTIASDNTAIVTASPSALTFTIGNWDTPQEVTVTAAADDNNASDDTATLTHTATGGYVAAVELPVTVTDDDTATLRFELSSYVTSEQANNRCFWIEVVSDLEVTGGFTVDLTTMDGTATAPADYFNFISEADQLAQCATVIGVPANYTRTPFPLTFAGTVDEEQGAYLSITGDEIAENEETMSVALANLQGTTAMVDLSSTASVRISDDDSSALTFDLTTIALPEAEYTYITGAAIPTLTLPPAIGGVAPLTYALDGAIPDGLAYDATARTLTGMPTTAADAVTLTYTVTDGANSSRRTPTTPLVRTFTVTINEALNFGGATIEPQAYIVGQTITPLTLPTAAGGVPTLTYTLTGTFPDGLTYTGGSDTTGGVLAGTPTAGAVATPLTYTATDSDASPNSVALTFMVSASTIPSVVSVVADGASITASPFTNDPGDPFNKVVGIEITFSEDIAVDETGGTPQLALNTGNPAGAGIGMADFNSIVNMSEPRVAAFHYVVRAGDNIAELAYTGTDALTLNGGTIRNVADTQNANLTLPMPGETNSLSASATIVLDTSAPVFGLSSTSTDASRETLNVTLGTADGTVIHDAQATDNGVTDTGITYTLTGTDAGTFSLSAAGALSPVAILNTETTYSIEITAADAAGNDATLYLSVVVANIPILTITSNVGITDTANIADGSITFTAGWSEAVSGFEFNDLGIGGGASNGVLSTVTEGLTYTFTATPLPPQTNDGVITIRVRANMVTATGSGNGNIETIETQAFDTLAPSKPTITTPVANAIITATEATAGVPLTGSGVETGGSITLCLPRVPGGTGTGCGGSRTLRDVPVTGTDWAYTLNAADITAMGQGSETLNVIANDAAGNPSVPFSRTITVDTTADPPTINAVSGGFINAAERAGGVEVTGDIGNDTLAITLCLNPVDAAVADCDGAGGGFTVTTIDTATTTWSRTLTNTELTPFGEGVLTFTAIATDNSGNLAVSDAVMVTVDITAPGAPVIGAVSSDDIINADDRVDDFERLLNGTTDAATTVTFCFGAADAACTDGTTSDANVTDAMWNYYLSEDDFTAMGEGTYTLRATAFDAAGNPSPVGSRPITIDTIGPVFPGTATTDTARRTIPAATGTLARTTIYDAMATDNGVLTEMQDAGLTYTLAGTDAGTFSLDTGTGELAPLSNLPTTVTTYSVDITATDAAGNAATQYLTINVVDRPTVTISDTVDTDTANRADGAITFTFKWSEAVTGFGEQTSDITVDGGTVTGATAAASLVPVTAGLTYTLTVTPTDNTAGTITVTVAARAVTANVGVDRTNIETTAMQAYDTAAPTAPTFAAALIAGDDTINDAEATATVTVTGGISSGTTGVTLCAGATSATDPTCAGGNTFPATVDTTASTWTYTLTDDDIRTTIGEGTFTLTAIAADAAGNPAVSAGRDIIIDTVAPGAPGINQVGTNDIISVANTIGSTTLLGTTDAATRVTLCFGGSNDACSGGLTRTNVLILADGISWLYNINDTDIGRVGQGENRTLRATATDAAGNPSPVGTRAITVDTVAPTAPAITTPIAVDNFINAAEHAAGVTVTGTNAVIGSDVSSDTTGVTLCAGTTTTTTNPVCMGMSFTATTTAAATTWSYTLTMDEITTFGEGPVTLTAIAADSVGNTAASGGRGITVDTMLPMFPGTATTATERMTINPATATAAGMEIYNAMATDNSRSQDMGLTYTLAGTDAMTFSLDTNTGVLAPVSDLPATVTTYSVDITATDEAGNAATQYLTIALSDIPTVEITNDATGANGAIANIDDGNITFTFVFTEPVTGFGDETSDITVGGGTKSGTVTGSGDTYMLDVTPTTNTNNGVLTITVAEDAAIGETTSRGNLAASETQAYDTAAPGAPEIGTVENDDIINAAERADLSGVILTGNTGAIGNDTTAVTVCIAGTDDACTSGEERDAGLSVNIWTYLLTDADFILMGEGPQTLRVTAFDAAGNPSTVVTRPVTIDTEAPDAPVINTPIAVDDFINAAEQTRGFTVAGTSSSDTDAVTLCLGATDVTDTDCTGGDPYTAGATGAPMTWGYTLTPADLSSLTDGALTFTAIATDEAGNPTVSSPGSVVTVDITAPVFTSGATGAVAVNAALTFTAYDAEATDAVTYSLSGNDASLFTIDATTGIVTYKTLQGDVTTHTITVTATDTAGNPALQGVIISVIDVPSAPTGVTLVPGNTQLTVSWTAVPDTNNGNTPITGYTATATGNSMTFTCTATATGCVITGLTNGTEYSVTVVATNSQGNSLGSGVATATPMAPAQSTTAPTTAPTGVMLTPGNAQLTVSWTAVPDADHGGAPITQYTATATGNSMTFACTAIGDAAATACTSPITSLANGTTYSVTVVATNSVGDGPASTPVTATPVAPTAPTAAPTGVTLTPGDAQITVSWTAVPDADNGGATILTYTATATETANTFTCTATVPATACAITSLANGTTYSVTVVATNSVGDSDTSTAVTATPVTDATPAPTFGTTTIADLTYTATATATSTAITPQTLPGATGGVAPLVYTLGPLPLPSDLAFDAATRVLSGTPTAIVTQTLIYTVTDSATDSDGTPTPQTASLTFTVTIERATTVTPGDTEPIALDFDGNNAASDPADGILTLPPSHEVTTVTVSAASQAATETPPDGVTFALTTNIAIEGTLTADATICLPTTDVPEGREPVLYHYTSGDWSVIGTDTATHSGYVCGTTNTFSPVGVGYTTPSETTDEPTDKATESARLTAISNILLPEVSRAMTDTTVSAITQRLDQAAMWNQQADDASPAGNYTIGGQSTLADVLRTGGQALADDTLNLRNMLGRSAFVLPLQAGDEWGNRLTLWGNGDYRAIGGDSGVSGGGMTWDGSLVSARVGVDAQVRDDLLAGAAVSWTDGDFDYGALTDDADDGGGNYALEMTTVHPYLNWNILPTGGLDLWATVGYGWGDVIIRDRVVETAQTSEATMTVLGGGLTSQLLQVAGATLRLKSEVMQTAMDLEGRDRIAALTVNARRVRVTLAGTHNLTLDDGSSLLTSLDFGMRHDGGDGRAGAGGEIGGGLEYRHPATRLTLASHSRVLLGHTGGYDDWGVGGMLSLQPGRDGQGLAISLAPAYGQTQTQTAQLWDQGAMGLTGTDAAALGQRMDAEVGYGLPAMGGSLLTPYSNMTWGGATREYRLGSRLTLPSGLTMSFEGVRGEPVGAVAAHRLQWQTGWRWLTASVQTSGAERRMSLKAEWRW